MGHGDGRLTDLEAVFELVDSIRGDQEARLQHVASEQLVLRSVLEEALARQAGALRTEIAGLQHVRA